MQFKLPKHVKNFKKRSLYASPGLFWQCLLILAFILVAGSFVFGFWFFKRINKELVLPPSKVADSQSIPKSRIDADLKYFTDRQAKSTQILNSPAPVVDPSL